MLGVWRTDVAARPIPVAVAGARLQPVPAGMGGAEHPEHLSQFLKVLRVYSVPRGVL